MSGTEAEQIAKSLDGIAQSILALAAANEGIARAAHERNLAEDGSIGGAIADMNIESISRIADALSQIAYGGAK